MAYINGQKIAFSSYLVDGKGYYNKEETTEMLEGKADVEMLDSKADKVAEATENNLVSLDANGNLKDSGTNAFRLANRYAMFSRSSDYTVPTLSNGWSGFRIPFESITQSTSGRYTLSNNNIQINYNGDETIIAEIQFDFQHVMIDGSQPACVQSFLQKNNSTISQAIYNGNAVWNHYMSASVITQLKKGDYIYLNCMYDSANPANNRAVGKFTKIIIREIDKV